VIGISVVSVIIGMEVYGSIYAFCCSLDLAPIEKLPSWWYCLQLLLFINSYKNVYDFVH
jgi:hypothetical protein